MNSKHVIPTRSRSSSSLSLPFQPTTPAGGGGGGIGGGMLAEDFYYFEKLPLVIEFGQSLCKAGLGGEAEPQCIVRTRELTQPYHLYPYSAVRVSGSPCIKQTSLENYTMAKYRLRVMLEDLFFKKLLIHPRERPVVICEGLMRSPTEKAALVDLLFNIYDVPSISFVPDLVSPLYCCGLDTGVVIDVGYTETRIMATAAGCPILHSLTVCPVGGASVNHELRHLLRAFQSSDPIALALIDNLSVEQLEDMKLACCYVAFDLTEASAHRREREKKRREKKAAVGGKKKSQGEKKKEGGKETQEKKESKETAGGDEDDAKGGGAAEDEEEEKKNESEVKEGVEERRKEDNNDTGEDDHAKGEKTSAKEEKEVKFPPFKSTKDIKYCVTSDACLTVKAEIRWKACEILFGGAEDSVTSIQEGICECLSKCPAEVARLVAQNLVLCGGTAQFRGFTTRLAVELDLHLAEEDKLRNLRGVVKFGVPCFSPLLRAWTGGSMHAGLEGRKEYKRADYDGGAPIPDWTTWALFETSSGDETGPGVSTMPTSSPRPFESRERFLPSMLSQETFECGNTSD
ncbi:actin-like protein alp4 [Cystoisospora suis]|uniref:Actin-like protein alp4 n=1 Tax=Cystoisospora suis TaxID=483139 RepID=A0A2C6KVM0_9APIC|nr:actin-like protein alp4 [Cystoisospora suis]